VVYRIADDDETGSDVVRVNSSSGEVSAARRLDREWSGVLSVRVLAEDSGRPSRTAYSTVNIHIEDTDDQHPTFTQHTYVRSVFLIYVSAGMLIRPRVTRPRSRPRPETARPRPRPKCQEQGQGRTSQDMRHFFSVCGNHLAQLFNCN